MNILDFKIDCPDCGMTIRVPFVPALKAKAMEDFDLAESSSRTKLLGLELWLTSVSLTGLFKFWLHRRLNDRL